MLIKALSSIEGSHKSQTPVIVPNSVFEADSKTAKRLIELGAAREASEEDVAMAKVKGLLIEAAEKPVEQAPAQKAPPAPKGADKPKTEAKADAKADDPL